MLGEGAEARLEGAGIVERRQEASGLLRVEDDASGAYNWLDKNGKLTFKGNFTLGLIVAGIGAAIAIVGLFLPLADTESSLRISGVEGFFARSRKPLQMAAS